MVLFWWSSLFLLVVLVVVASSLEGCVVEAFRSSSPHHQPRRQHQHQHHHHHHHDTAVAAVVRITTPTTSRTTTTTRLFVSSSSMAGATFVNVDETAPRDIPAMEAWCSALGVQRADGLQLTTTTLPGQEYYAGDVSVVTTQNLPANTPVVCVPSTLILSSQKILQEETGLLEVVEKLRGSKYFGDMSDETTIQHIYLIVKILLEYEKGDQSPWFGWLNAMPRYYTNGASMTNFCYQCLPPLMRTYARKERTKLSTVRSVLKEIPFLSDAVVVDNLELTKWAFQIAYTRATKDPTTGDLRIVPLVDMFNHGGNAPEITISYDGQGNCYAQTTCDVTAGSPLRISYGDSTNPSFLFARYGFLDEDSPASFCKIMLTPEEAMNPQPLLDMGYAFNRMLFFGATGDVSDEVWDVLLYQLLRDVGQEQPFYQAHLAGDVTTKQAYHQQYWSQTSAKLQNHIDTFLYELDELSAKTHGQDLRQHPRIPIILQHNEFVKRTFLAVRNRYFGGGGM